MKPLSPIPNSPKPFTVDKQLADFDKRMDKILGKIDPRVLLGEVDALLRDWPTLDDLVKHTEPSLAWRGRAAAVIKGWNSAEAIGLRGMFQDFDSKLTLVHNPNEGYAKLMSLLHQARHDLQMQTVGPQSVVVEQGKPYAFFEHVRRIAERATEEVFLLTSF